MGQTSERGRYTRECEGAYTIVTILEKNTCALELVYYEVEIRSQATRNERLERYTNSNIGFNIDPLNAYYKPLSATRLQKSKILTFVSHA